MSKNLQYENGYEDGKKNGRVEFANELNRALLELKRNNTVVDISTVIQMIEKRKQDAIKKRKMVYSYKI